MVDEILLTQAQTAAFWGILFAHFGYVLPARSVHESAFTFNPFSNPWLLGGIALSLLIRLIPTLVPEAASLFRTVAFPIEWWSWILACFSPASWRLKPTSFAGDCSAANSDHPNTWPPGYPERPIGRILTPAGIR